MCAQVYVLLTALCYQAGKRKIINISKWCHPKLMQRSRQEFVLYIF